MGASCYEQKDKKGVQNINIIVSDGEAIDKRNRKKRIQKKKKDEIQIEEKKPGERIYPSFDDNTDNNQEYKPEYTPYKQPEEIDSIIYDKIFLDGNSDNYDMILNFESFEQLKTNGWTANFSIEGWKKYQDSIKTENIVIGVVGIKNRGKSFWLKRIMQNENYKPNDGFLVNTFGMSCGFPVLKKDNKYQAFITIDSEGKDNPLLQNLFVEEILQWTYSCTIRINFVFQIWGLWKTYLVRIVKMENCIIGGMFRMEPISFQRFF